MAQQDNNTTQVIIGAALSATFKQTLENAKKAVTNFGSGLDNLAKKQKAVDKIKELQTRLPVVQKEFLKAKDRLDKLNNSIAKGATQTSDLTNKWVRANQTFDKAKAVMDRTERSFTSAQRSAKRLGIDVDNLSFKGRRMFGIYNGAKMLGGKMKNGLMNAINNPMNPQAFMGSAMQLMTVGLPMKSMISSYATYQSGIKDIMKTIPNSTPELEALIEKEVKHLALGIAKPVPDILHGYKSIVSGLTDITDMKDRLKEAGNIAILVEKTAQTYKLNAEATSDTLMAIRTTNADFRDDPKKMEIFMNKLAIAAHTGASYGDITQGLKQMNTAKDLGIKEDEFLTLLTVMNRSFGKGHGGEAETATRNIMQQLIAPLRSGKLSKSQHAGLEAAGIDSNVAIKMAQKDSGQFLQYFFKKLQEAKSKGGLGDKKVEALNELFGVYTVSNVSILANQMGLYNDTLAQIGDKTRHLTELNHAYHESTKEITNQWQILKNAIEYVAIEAVKPLGGDISKLLEITTSLVGKVREWVEQHPHLIELAGTLLGIMVAFKATMLGISLISWATGLPQIISMFKELTALAKLKSIYDVLSAAALNPAVMLPLLAMGGLGYLYYNYNDEKKKMEFNKDHPVEYMKDFSEKFARGDSSGLRDLYNSQNSKSGGMSFASDYNNEQAKQSNIKNFTPITSNTIDFKPNITIHASDGESAKEISDSVVGAFTSINRDFMMDFKDMVIH